MIISSLKRWCGKGHWYSNLLSLKIYSFCQMILDSTMLMLILVMESLNQIRSTKKGLMKFINYMVQVHLGRQNFKILNQTGIQ
jgi:hypothetical protein